MPPLIVILAGPNGSGKSTISQSVLELHKLPFVNADVIEQQLKLNRKIDITGYGITKSNFQPTLDEYFKQAYFISPDEKDGNIILDEENNITLKSFNTLSYEAAIIADIIRRILLQERKSFCFETVLSHPSKIEFLKLAREQGFEIESYFMTTNDPEINVSRVAKRVRDENGHDVPTEKITERWHRSCELVTDLIDVSDRMQIYDNSASEAQLIFEVEDAAFEVYDTENPWVIKYLIPHLNRLEEEYNDADKGKEDPTT